MPEPAVDNEEKEGDEEKSKVPKGITPVFLSSATQQIFHCEADVDVTDEKTHILLSKKSLLEDIHNRAAVSDFQPLKKIIKSYPGDELLLVYDYEFKYEQNFYLCVTEEAKELILNPPQEESVGERKVEEEDNEEIPTTPEPKEWECLGSDKEILEGIVTQSRPLLQFTITRKRRYFKSPCVFSDSTSSKELYTEVTSIGKSEEEKDIIRLELENGIQAIPEVIDKSCQTEWRYPKNASVQYESRVMNEDDIKEVWFSDDTKEFLDKVAPRMELCLQQNEIMDIFPDDYLELADDDGIMANKSDTTFKEYQSFTDLKFSKDKVVTWIDWHPNIKGIIAVSCGEPYTYDERVELSFKLMHANSLVLIWSFADPIHPVLFLEAPEDIVCFKFNPSNPNLIAGGCINGQVVLWDITEYQNRLQINKSIESSDNRGIPANMAIFETEKKSDHAPIVPSCALSSIEGGHSRTISDIAWIPQHIEVCHKTLKILENSSQFSSQLITIGLDGVVLFWDTRSPPQNRQNKSHKGPVTSNPDNPFNYIHLTWKPFYKIQLSRSTHPGLYAGTRISLRERPIPKPKHGHVDEIDEVDGNTEGGVMPHKLEISPGTVMEEASTLFCLGSEEGEFVFVNWTPTRDPESGKATAPKPEHFFFAHSGTMTAVERSPFFPDVILTVGGWNFSIWKEGLTSDALLKSGNSQVTLTGGAWSPTRPGVFFIAKHNGNIDVWDLMDRSHVPALAQNISSLPITYIVPWSLSSRQLMLAAGDSGGTLHILEVPWSLSHASGNEHAVMESFFDREVKRLEFVGERARMRDQEKKLMDDEKIAKQEEEKQGVGKVEDDWEEKARKEYDEYLSMENTILIELGIRQPETQED